VREIRKITIPQLSEYIRIAEKRAVKPYLKGSKKKLPKKYQTDEYRWNAKGYLIDSRGVVVPSNPIVAGTPRDWRINGQDVYNQKIKHSARGGIMAKLHAIFDPILKKVDKIDEQDYPLHLRLEFHTLDHNKEESRERNIDNDNKWVYEKVIQDSLTHVGVIRDDNPYVINENSKKTIFVTNPDDVKLDIIIYGRE